jgi:hypothetical protein
MTIHITYNEKGQMARNEDTENGYWCELDYWSNGEWKQYRNSLGFVINWTEQGIRQ